MSPGQVGLLIGLNRYADRKGPSIAGILPSLISRHWPYAAYHLRLELMEAAAFGAHAMTEDERLALIAAIEALPPVQNIMLSTAVVDALKMLGALDDGQAEYVATVKEMIAAALADQSNPLMWDVAAGLWNGQFDHPYDGAYCEAWNDLSPADRKALLVMAAQSVDNYSMFVSAMMIELASHSDQSVGMLLARWTTLPPTKCVMPQEAIRNFEMAHIALARLRIALPKHAVDATRSEAGNALSACSELLYWLNRDDLSMADRRLNCAAPLRVLSRHEAGVAASVIAGSDLMVSEGMKRLPGSEPVVTSFAHVFPREIAAVYRAALEKPETQSGYFEYFRRDEQIEQALSGLGHFGDADDIELLRRWSQQTKFGRTAIQAIREIEESPQTQKLRANG